MNVEDLRDFCLSLKGAYEDFPFDDVSLVLKVQNKMFGLIPLDVPELRIALKCDPERAIELREQYSAITTAGHFNKKHWNAVNIDNSISETFVKELIVHSYELVVAGLTKAAKQELENL